LVVPSGGTAKHLTAYKNADVLSSQYAIRSTSPALWLLEPHVSFHSAYCLFRITCCPAGAAADLFDLLGRLPRQLHPPALSAVHSLELDVFPAAPSDWLLLQGLPCLQELLLPPFMPSLPHAHLPMVAELTQLTALTASVQVCVGLFSIHFYQLFYIIC
jgi:hypothetical protein